MGYVYLNHRISLILGLTQLLNRLLGTYPLIQIEASGKVVHATCAALHHVSNDKSHVTPVQNTAQCRPYRSLCLCIYTQQFGRSNYTVGAISNVKHGVCL